MIKEAIEKIVLKEDLTYDEAYAVMNEIMNGETTPTQNAAFLAALSTKSTKAETIDEISGCAQAMREHALTVDGGDMDEPVADKVRGILDGHIVLSRDLASKQHYPAIDMITSISRLAKRVSGENTKKAVQRVRRWIATYAEQEDYITAGVYQKGNNLETDEAIDHHKAIEEFLCQDVDERLTIEDTLKKLSEISGIEISPEEYSEIPS